MATTDSNAAHGTHHGAPHSAPHSGPLSGLRVLDLTRVRSGPTCVRQLGDWGADVIKVEAREASGESQDFSARHDPDFQNLHRNKRAIALDLKQSAGMQVFHRLVADADIVVENFRPDVKHRLGIDYATLSANNPRLIYASISGFGEDGPYADRPGVDQVAQGMAGLMSVTGEAGRGPMRVGIALADLSAGLFAAMGILTALYERERSGRGQWVQTSLLAAQLFMLDFQGARWLMQGEVPQQSGNNHPTGVPTGSFRTRDGWANIAPTPPMWARFCKAIGHPEWIAHADYATPALRRKHRDALNALIEAVTSAMESATLIEKMNAAGVPCGPINNIAQAFDDPQVKHLGIAQTVQSAALGQISLIGQPFSLSRTPSALHSAAPEYAEHAQAILQQLGYDAGEIDALRAAGVI